MIILCPLCYWLLINFVHFVNCVGLYIFHFVTNQRVNSTTVYGSCDIVHILMISVMQIYIYSGGRIGELYLTGCVVATFNINDN